MVEYVEAMQIVFLLTMQVGDEVGNIVALPVARHADDDWNVNRSLASDDHFRLRLVQQILTCDDTDVQAAHDDSSLMSMEIHTRPMYNIFITPTLRYYTVREFISFWVRFRVSLLEQW